jgi:hypothetical protein
MISRLLLACFAAISTWCHGQWQFVPIEKSPAATSTSAARTRATALSLPFWDDFSFARSSVPDARLYSSRQSVWVNSSMGIRPPSLQVATFDGLDSLGRPYSVNDVLAKGFADRLVSWPLRLDEVAPAERTTVYMSFFYQFRGNGEPPDEGDVLNLYFRNRDQEWELVWSVENRGQLSPSQFVQVLLPIAAERFFHDQFQFRFQNFARLSGPYDTWHLDYLYINKGRTSIDTSYPDRTLVSQLGSGLTNYSAIPYRHFTGAPAPPLARSTFTIYNLRAGNLQPLNYNLQATVTSFRGNTTDTRSRLLDSAQSVGAVDGLEFRNTQTNRTPPLSLFDLSADSVRLQYQLKLNSADNIPITEPQGDYTPNFAPIDFRNNDTLRLTQMLSNYYAYDDGIAEYGAALNQAGAQVAYQYDMSINSDTVVAVDFFFPRFGDETQQVITLQIWNDLTGSPIHQQVVNVERSQNNQFRRRRLSVPIIVGKRFFIGWRQTSTAVIAVGLDKDNNSESKIFVNTNGTWAPSSQLNGSLMMRPVFGKGTGALPPVGLVESEAVRVFPNPSSGTIYLPASAIIHNIQTLMGTPVAFEAQADGDYQRIQITADVNGILVIRFQVGQALQSAKVWIQSGR